METWFTSDTHFGHTNIIKYSNRPFRSVEEMDEVLIQRINELVLPADTLYHLGDFAFWRRGEQFVADYRDRINCKNIILIYGNHDGPIRQSYRLQRMFKSVHEKLEVRVNGKDITLDHYANRVWNKSHHGAYHLYGHSHGSLPDDPTSLSFDVGVDCTNFFPYNMDDVNEVMNNKSYAPVDHHGV